MVHGMLVVANMPDSGLKILRFSRMDPLRKSSLVFLLGVFIFVLAGTNMVQMWTSSAQKETMSLDVHYGVFVFDEWMKVKEERGRECHFSKTFQSNRTAV